MSSLEELQKHLDFETHEYSDKPATQLAKVRDMWVDQCQVEKQQVDTLSLEPSVDASNAAQSLPIGWAIHERVQRRFSSKLKELLDTLFEDGERTKNKCTPEHAMTLIRKQLSID